MRIGSGAETIAGPLFCGRLRDSAITDLLRIRHGAAKPLGLPDVMRR
jgi:hypothetical protein